MSRLRLHRTEAVVLKRHDFGEADRILTLFTPDRGKVRAIAKGVRRITSRKAGHVELFVHASVLLAEGRSLDILTQAETVSPHRGLREDLLRTTYAYHVAELVDRFTDEGLPAPDVFGLLCGALDALDASAAADPSLVARFFELRLLGFLGYRPQLYSCPSCGRELSPAGNAFGSDAGGVLCPECARDRPEALPLDEKTFRILRYLQTREWAAVRAIELTPSTRASLEKVMHAYVRHLLERDLRSVEFLQGLRRVARANADLFPRSAADSGDGRSTT